MNEKTSLDRGDNRDEWFFDRVDAVWRNIAANLFCIVPLPEEATDDINDSANRQELS